METNKTSNPFKELKEPALNNSEIASLNRKLDGLNTETSKKILTLLEAIAGFDTATDNATKKMRDFYQSDKQRLEVLNALAKKLGEFSDSIQKNELATDAFSYSLTFVKTRLSELEKEKDAIYDVYSNQDNDLLKIMNGLTKSKQTNITQKNF